LGILGAWTQATWGKGCARAGRRWRAEAPSDGLSCAIGAGAAPVRDGVDAERLLLSCRSGSEPDRAEAYQQLGEILYRALVPRAGRDPRTRHLAADAAQEALVTVWQHLDAGRGPSRPSSFVSWSVRIAINKLRDAQRRLEPQAKTRVSKRVGLSRQVRIDADTGDEGHALAERLADRAATEAASGPERDDLREAIMGLQGLTVISENSKTVLLLGYLCDWEDEELAAHLGTTKSNVHVIRCRDLGKLRNDQAFLRRLRRALS
jgi:RNA polymerase sigma factor (sigma-70 family)